MINKDNTNAVTHGAFSKKISLKKHGRDLITNGISYLGSLIQTRKELVVLLQRIERVWLIVLKFDEYEDARPKEIDFTHYKYKATYENSLRLHLKMFFDLANEGKKADESFIDIVGDKKQ